MNWAAVEDRVCDRLNPVLLKELRQAVRSRLIVVVAMLFLAVLVLTALIILLNYAAETAVWRENSRLGTTMFGWVGGILGVASLVIPLHIGARFSGERTGRGSELYMIASLTPGQLVRGKFQAGLSLLLLMLSLSAPFMVLAYLLRGLSLGLVFTVVLLLQVGASVLLMFTLAAGSGRPRNANAARARMAATSALAVFLGLTILPGAIMDMVEELSRGQEVFGREYWIMVSAILAVAASVESVLYSVALCQLSPKASNRFMPLRISLSGAWLVGFGAAWGVESLLGGTEAQSVWVVCSMVIFSLIPAVVLSEPDGISFRVRRQIPRSGLLRLVAYPYFSGPVRGVCFCVLHAGVTLLVAVLWQIDEEVILRTSVMATYGVAYALTASLFERRFFSRTHSRRSITWVIALVLVAVLSCLPLLLDFLGLLHGSGYEYFPGNIWAIFQDDDTQAYHLAIAVVWLLCAAAMNVPWFFRSLRDFTPVAKTAAPRSAPADAPAGAAGE